MDAMPGIVAKAVELRTVPKAAIPPKIADAELALQLDEQWRGEVRKKISGLMRDARAHRRAAWKRVKPTKKRTLEEHTMRWYNLGQASAFIAAARRLKGLL